MRTALPPNDSAYAQLAEAIRRRPLAVVGSGLSLAGGYPSWATLIEDLEAEADVQDPRPPKATAIVAPTDDKLWSAQEYRERMGEPRYRTYLADRFKPNGRPLPESLKRLVKLPFKAFLTTNYDELITQALAATAAGKSVLWKNQFAVREFFHELSGAAAPSRTVLHLHGRHDDPESIILTEFDYVAHYAASDANTRRLFALFSTQCLVFLGFSLSDPDLMTLLRQVQATFGPGRPRHFAILPLDDPSRELQYRRLLERKYGIIPCFYMTTLRTRADGTTWNDHSGLEILLARLATDVDPGAIAATRGVFESAPAAPSSAAKMADPNKGEFGGQEEASGRRLSAMVTEAAERPGWFLVILNVESTGTASPLTGHVTFHLHPSFRRAERSVPVQPSGKASLRLLSYGSFTVGAVADGGATRLELDLAQLPGVPAEFKAR